MKTPFRGFSAILYKEFIVIFRDRGTLFFMFFPPIMQIIAFGFALDNDVKHMAIVVYEALVAPGMGRPLRYHW